MAASGSYFASGGGLGQSNSGLSGVRGQGWYQGGVGAVGSGIIGGVLGGIGASRFGRIGGIGGSVLGSAFGLAFGNLAGHQARGTGLGRALTITSNPNFKSQLQSNRAVNPLS